MHRCTSVIYGVGGAGFMDKKTPLYDKHVALGGKIVPFAGYLLPVMYKAGVIAEHMAVRTKAGLFDVSHMGEAFLSGPDALNNLNRLLTNDFTNLAVGCARYSPMCNERGGVIDDLIVYRLEDTEYMLVLNASNREKDVQWIAAHVKGDVEFTDKSDEIAEIAIQGPASKAIISKLAGDARYPVKNFTFARCIQLGGIEVMLSRTGYTGEFGYELYTKRENAERLWDALLETGADDGLIPCGLGARDTLRLEAAMPLYGHEMDEDITPLEAGLGWAVKPQSHDFIGKEAILERGQTKVRVGLKVTGKGIVRERQDVFRGEKKVGYTTSGTHLPYLGGAYAMAILDSGNTDTGTQVEVDVRGRRIAAEVVTLPFYKRTI